MFVKMSKTLKECFTSTYGNTGSHFLAIITTFAALLLGIIGICIVFAIPAFIFFKIYTPIAYNFNLPEFNFWFFFFIVLGIRIIIGFFGK